MDLFLQQFKFPKHIIYLENLESWMYTYELIECGFIKNFVLEDLQITKKTIGLRPWKCLYYVVFDKTIFWKSSNKMEGWTTMQFTWQ